MMKPPAYYHLIMLISWNTIIEKMQVDTDLVISSENKEEQIKLNG